MDERTAPHLEELTRALGDLEKSGIRAEFDRLLAFSVPPDVAKESILRKFGGKKKALKVKDLSSNLKNFEITGRLLELEEKPINSQQKSQEKPAKLYTGILADETGSVMFSSWKELPCSPNDVVNIKNASTRFWQNRVRLSIGEQALVSKLPDSSLPQSSELSRSKPKKLIEIGAADFSIGTTACVLQLSQKEILVRGRQSRVIPGVLADETGRVPFTAWIELPLIDIGSIIRIEEAQVRMFRGMPSVNILSSTKVSLIGQEKAKELAFTFESVRKDPVPIKIREIDSRESMFDVITSGNIVSVRPGSGIILRCPECGRVIQKGSCRVHGKVEGIRDMRIKAVIDDGTGAMSVMFPRELAEIIYGKTLEEAEQLMISDISKDAVYEDLRRFLTGRYLAVRGNSSKGDYGIYFVAENTWVPENDLAVRVVELLHRLETGKENKQEDSQILSGGMDLA